MHFPLISGTPSGVSVYRVRKSVAGAKMARNFSITMESMVYWTAQAGGSQMSQESSMYFSFYLLCVCHAFERS